MFENLRDATPFNQAIFVTIAGILVVFASLITFFLLIKLLSKLYPEKN